MKQMLVAAVLVLAIINLVAGQNPQQRPREKSPLTAQKSAIGTWEGKLEDIPAVEIRLRLEGDHLAGNAVFYVVDPGAGEVVKGKKAEAELIDARAEGATVTFKIKRPDGKVIRFEMRLTSEEEVILRPIEDGGSGEEMSVKMRKVKP